MEGWSFPEPGCCWTIGKSAQLSVACPHAPAGLTLQIRLRPMLAPPRLPAQHLRILVNGVTVGATQVSADLTLGFAVPHAALGPTLLITLLHPDAASPLALGASLETRVLGVAVEEITFWPAPSRHLPVVARPPLPPPGMRLDDAVRAFTGIDPAKMIANFESVGQNCDFGLSQRASGVERLGLLRFAGIGQPGLLRGLADGFACLLNADLYRIEINEADPRKEYFLRVGQYAVEFHTEMTPRDSTPADVSAQMARYFGFIQRKFNETLRAADTVFVLQTETVLEDSAAIPVLNALRQYGDNALLYVVTGNTLPHGAVERRMDGLYRGWRADRFDIDHPERIDIALWQSLCANAYRFWRESGRGVDW